MERLDSRFRYEGPLNRESQRVREWLRKELGVFWFLRRVERQFSLSLRAIPDSALITLGKKSRNPSDFLCRWKGFIRVYQSSEDIFDGPPIRQLSVWQNPDRKGRVILQAGRLKKSGMLMGVYSSCSSPSRQRLMEVAVINQWPGWTDSPQAQFRFRVLRTSESTAWQVGGLDSSFQYRYREPTSEERSRVELEVRGKSVHISARPIFSEVAEFQLRVPLRCLPRVES